MGTSLREEMISLSLFGGRLALAELILFSVFLTDILLLGIMGEINLSGVLLANAAFVLCYVTALGFLQGALPLASQRFETGDRGGYHAIVAMSLLLGGGMAVLVLLIFLVFPVALRLFDYRPDLIAESWRYISWVLPAYMLAMIYIPVRNGVIATGSSRWFLTLSLVTLVLNAGVSYLLGFGISLGGLTITGMGTSGIALASTIVDSMLFGGFVWLLHRSGFRLSGIPVDALAGRRWPVVRGQLAPIMGIGIPIGIVFFVDSTLFSSALMLVGRHDVQGMAAIGLIFEWSALAIMVPVGLSEAIVQRVASATGKAGPQRMTIATITKAALMVCTAYVALLAFIHFGLGINVPVYFIVDAAAHPDLVARLDELAMLGFLVAAFHAVIIVLAAILRGLLDVKTSMVATLACYWGIGLGLTVLFVEILRLDVWYALLAVVIALATSTAVIALRLRLRLRIPRDAV
ncbi:MAG: MATE family efflux transporter [Alphaproteobacteria bacterium]